MKNIAFWLGLALCVISCTKRNDPVSWMANYSIPISNDTIDFQEFIGSDRLYLSNDQSHLIFIDTFELFTLQQDDLIPDINFDYIDTIELPSVALGVPFSPGFTIPYTFSQSEKFNFSDIQLTEASFNSLLFHYTIQSNIDGAIDFNLTIPSAKDSLNQILSQVIKIPDNNGQMNSVSGNILLTNYLFDLTDNGTDFNKINTSYTIGSSSENIDDITLDNNSFISISLELSEMNIKSVKGYMGSTLINENNNISLPFMEGLSSNTIDIDSPAINLSIQNGIGVDAQLLIDELTFQKGITSLYLNHPVIGQSINISRAIDLGWDFLYGDSEILIDENNSNIEEIISFFPEEINLNYQLSTNPLGNHSGYNDFFIANHPLTINLETYFPLKFNINDLHFTDTISIPIHESLIIEDASIFIEISNEFPIESCISLKIPNGDSLELTPNCISSCNVNSQGTITNSSESNILIYLNNEAANQLLDNKKIIIVFTFNSPNTTMNFPIGPNQNIKYKMGVTFNSKINIP